VPSAEQVVEDESEEEDGSEKKKTKKTKKATQKAEKPRRVGVSNIGKKPEEVTLEDALYFLAFPIHLGEHATEAFVDEEKEINRQAHAGEVTLSLGKFGYYVKFGETLASIPAKFMREELQNDPRNMTLAQAKDLIEKKRRKPDSTRTKGRFASKAAKEKLAKEKAEKKKQRAAKAKTTKTTTTKKATSKESDVNDEKETTPKRKKPLTAYFQFAKDNRENVKKENPGVSLGEASKKLGAMWKELDATTKSKYETDAKSRLEQFKREEENTVAN
jgi:topoisomerase IA-like protein